MIFNIDYKFSNANVDTSHQYLFPALLGQIRQCIETNTVATILDHGCGNGSLTASLADHFPSIKFIGVDPSPEAERFHSSHQRPNVCFLSWEEFQTSKPMNADIVLSVEVIEHVFLPRNYVETTAHHLLPGGHTIVTTPFHGYWKNLVISILGGWDKHFTALWDYGHIKFWSPKTLDRLFAEQSGTCVSSTYAGRKWPLSKSMVRTYQI